MSIQSVPTSAPRHKWPDSGFTVIAPESKSGCEETHRVCTHCHIIKITIHPPHGNPYSLWQYPDGERADGLTPPCCCEVPFQ